MHIAGRHLSVIIFLSVRAIIEYSY